MSPSLDAVVDAISSWQADRRVPGVALVVSDRERTLHVGLRGIADRDGMRPVAPHQRWQIGSISKAFSSIAVLQLQDAGRLAVTDRVIDHLPWAEHLHPDMTLHHLMTHTAGLPGGSEWTPDSLAESAMQGRVGSPQPPGAPFWYSNPGYELLGDVIEAVVGVPLEQHLERTVLRPLGMGRASASVVTGDHGIDVRGHRPPRDDVLWRADSEQTPDVLFPTCTADGAIVATPDDMGHYLRLLLNGGHDGVLGAADFATLAARQVSDGDGWYGYGLRTAELPDQVTVGHSGGMVGMFADVRVDRDRGLGVCLLVNGYCDVTEAGAHLLRLVCGLPSDPPEWTPQDPRDDTADHQWISVVGLYRAYNPWAPTLRVLHAGGELRLADPVTGETQTLHPESDLTFRVGRPDSPDVVAFDLPVSGRCQRLIASGCTYGRARRDPSHP